MLNASDPLPIEHVARKYQTYPGSQYVLPADDIELQRLVLQHKILTELFESKIVLAPADLDHNAAVLDIGTGPGIWILDLANAVNPSVPMFAVDIESRLFPSSPPKNIEFRIDSVTHLPTEWTAAFSLVHQRLLVAALQIREWPVALSEIYRVLRPGGWVQITEGIAWTWGENPDRPCMEKLITISRCLAKSRNIYANCARDIPMMLSEAGFWCIQRH